MKAPLSILALAALACVILQCHRLHLTRTLYFYCATQFVFTAICLAAGRSSEWAGPLYYRAFCASMALNCVAVVLLTAQFCATMPGWRFASLICLACGIFALVVGNSFLESLRARSMLAGPQVVHVASCAFLIFCGTIGIISLAWPDQMVRDVIRAVVSLLWLTTGAYGLVEANLYLRSHALVVAKLSATPILLSIAAFGFLGFFLMNQAEVSRQADPITAAIVEAH